jgi:translocation and assembly module TamA
MNLPPGRPKAGAPPRGAGAGRALGARPRLALAVALAMLTSGCALLGKKDEPAGPPPTVRLEVQAPGDLKPLLETFLDLGRLGVLAPGEPIPESELLRLIAAAPAQARALLETEGYFNAEIVAERPPGQPDTVVLRVQPGPRTMVDEVRIDVRGPMAEHTARGERQAQEAQRAVRHTWALPTGAPFRNRDWANAKNAALAQLRAQGYAAASWVSTNARVDAQTQRAQLDVVADSGPLFHTGALEIRGLKLHDEKVVRNLAGFAPGTPATEQLLLDYQERLQNVGLFERVSIQLDDDVQTSNAAKVTVRLTEQKLQQAVVGVGISANIGPRISLEHVHRKVFGWPATARNKIEYGKLRQAWEGELSTHPGRRFYRNLLGWTAERIESDTDVVGSVRVRVGRTQDTRLIDRLYFVEVERGTRRVVGSEREQTDAISLNNHLVWRRLDSVVLPTDGYSIALQGGAGHARSNFAPSGPFIRAWGRATGYWPIGRSWFGSARVELGQVFVQDGVVVPDSQRFRAGGDDSVRGYAYRSLGPVVDGVVASGNVVFTASAEIARPILARLPSLWGAAFIDVGRAADRWSDLKPAIGFGVGLRLRSPVGPLRVDYAWGEELNKGRLHLSVGVAF